MAKTPSKSGISKNSPRFESVADLKQYARIYTKDAVDTVYEIMSDDTQDAPIRLKAADMILDRAYGKPGTTVEVTGEGGKPTPASEQMVRKLSPEDRKILRQIARRTVLQDVDGPVVIEVDEATGEPIKTAKK